MDYIEVIREALDEIIDADNIDDITSDNDTVKVSFYDFEEFKSELESLSEDGTSLSKELKSNIDYNIKVRISMNRELLMIDFLDD
jgi:hypothetical protein